MNGFDYSGGIGGNGWYIGIGQPPIYTTQPYPPQPGNNFNPNWGGGISFGNNNNDMLLLLAAVVVVVLLVK